jgi:hypothetical protein
LVFIPGWDCRVGIDGMIVLLAHRICLLDFVWMLLTIKLLIGPSVVDRQELCIYKNEKDKEQILLMPLQIIWVSNCHKSCSFFLCATI